MRKLEKIERNTRWLSYRKFLFGALFFACLWLGATSYALFIREIPEKMYLYKESESHLNFDMPVTVVATVSDDVSNEAGNDKEEIVFNEMNGEAFISSELTKNVTLQAGESQSYNMKVNLFGVIPIKEMTVDVVEEKKVLPLGTPVGIYMHTDGVLVLGCGEVTCQNRMKLSPAENILKEGDYILEVDGKSIQTKTELIQAVEASDGVPMELKIKRGEENFLVEVTPVLTQEGVYKIGVWIRDSAQGIGTLSFVDEEGNFGALGHGINDSDTGTLLDLGYGALYETEIVGIRKGAKSEPGELTGVILLQDEKIVGDIEKNTDVGIYGTIENTEMLKQMEEKMLPVGLRQEVIIGEAQILCKLDGALETYTIQIEGINNHFVDDNRGMELKITDERLKARTGGIVQGMSGSPIIQDGKIIGAVTHVLVNDPTRGYGIFIENMLEH